MTGGVTSELFAADILDKDKFWADELMNVNKLFLFGLAQMGGTYGERRGIIEKHAYSIMEARELENFRLLKIRYIPVPPGFREEVVYKPHIIQLMMVPLKSLLRIFGH